MWISASKNKPKHVSYYINTNKTILYIYNKKKNVINRFFSDSWAAMNIEVEVLNDDFGTPIVEVLDLKTIISKQNDFIIPVTAISSTIKPAAFFIDDDDELGISTNYLNEFLGSVDFIRANEKNKFSRNKNIINLLEKEAPVFFTLIKNLFYLEKDDVIINFMHWLRVCAFEDRHQDILWMFFGTSDIHQGQGAGKGVLISFLTDLLSGLVVSISNSTYENNFNSNLMNKKIVVFDEVNFKTLKYEIIKDITGSGVMRIEFKGREPINSVNVSSFMLFSNEHYLHDKITQDDRRTFLIRPNPKNESLKKIINKKYGGFKEFKKLLNDEKESIIHIIAKSVGKVLSPNEITTQAKLDYFKNKSAIEMIDFKEFYKILANKKMTQKLLEIIESNNLIQDNIKINIIKNDTMNYKLFKEIYQILLNHGLINKKESPLYTWERIKEYAQKNGYSTKNIDLVETKIYKKYREKNILVNNSLLEKRNSKKFLEIKKIYRDLFGEKKPQLNPQEQLTF